MKQILLLILSCVLFSSCCTIFSSSKQAITFTGQNGTRIYDAATNIKIAEIKNENSVTTKIGKKLNDKQLIAKKEGFQNTPFMLEATFNAASLWNLLFWPGFIVDLGTGKINKWENTIINVEMEPVQTSNN